MTSQIVTQEMIDAYYEYTHLTPDRRKFVTKLHQMVETDRGRQSSRLAKEWSEGLLMSHAGEAKLPQ